MDRDHPYGDLYYRKARYKVYWGGRGAAKSWAFAEALIRLAAAVPLRILCLREYQKSIKDSSHRILKDTITRLGMDSWFHVTADGITSRNGSEFIFKGAYNQLNSLRSTEGIDICWIEEAHSISEATWRVLIPTIRKTGSEIWVSFNMDDENDATYRRLVAVKRPDAIVHHINYDQNPYFVDSPLYSEMLFDKATDFELYQHIWLGYPKKVSKAIILSGKYRVEEFDTEGWREYGQDQRLFYGMDFGHAQDPNALLRMWVKQHKREVNGLLMPVKSLMITHEAYGHAELNEEMVDFIESVPGTREWPIKGDNSRPETISWIKNQGFQISAAEKWDGSVKDGIAHLRGYDQIIIHPRCEHTAREAHLWRYKVDPKIVDEHGQPQVLPIVVDKHNHTWDGARYGLDGQIMRGGVIGTWQRLGEDPQSQLPAVDPTRSALTVWETMAQHAQ